MSLIQNGPVDYSWDKAEEQPKQAAPKPIMASEQDFMALIGQTSMQMPVVVVFHKNASPASQKMQTQLQHLIEQAGEQIQLAVIDIDQSPMLASQLQINAVPTVMAFFQGRPLDGFAGPQEDHQLRQFLGRILGKELVNPEEAMKEALDIAEQALDDGKFEDALMIAEQILQAMPEFTKALVVFIRAQAGLRGVDFALSIIDQLEDEQKQDADIQALIKRLELSQNAASDDEMQTLQDAYNSNPADLKAASALAEAYMGKEAYGEAIALWLEIFGKDRTFDDGLAKSKLLEIFEILGSEDARVIEGRRKFSALLW